MKKMGYVIGLLVGIPLFIIVVNFLFFRGNNPSDEQIKYYINNSVIDTIIVPKGTPYTYEHYITKISRRNRSSAFLYKYPFYSQKYKKHCSVMIFEGFDSNSMRRIFMFGKKPDGDPVSVRINKEQLQNSAYGTKENPVPIFPIDLLNINLAAYSGNDPFHVSEELNFIFVREYLKFFLPKKEFKEMFKD